MPRFTRKQVAGYFKAHARSSSIGGGTVANDNYNLAHFGITDAEYRTMRRYLSDKFGICLPPVAEQRRALTRAD